MIKFGVGDTVIYKYKDTLILAKIKEEKEWQDSLCAYDTEVICGNQDIYGEHWEIAKVIERGNVEVLAVVNTEFDYHTWIQDNPEYFI